MKLISWNVAGFRACLKKGFEDVFKELDADIYCLQESKLLDSELSFKPEGYDYYLYPAKKRGYSGTLVYTRIKPLEVYYGIGIDEYDDEGRVITLEFNNFFLVCVYVPNVKRDLSRMESRMYFEDEFRNYLVNLDKRKPVIMCGDLNVAHEEIDIKNAKGNIGNAGFTYEERGKFSELLNAGFTDSFRYFNPDKKDMYSWWSFMGHAREKNIGWRIDYFIISNSLRSKVSNPEIYMDIMGSDHCPIGLTYEE